MPRQNPCGVDTVQVHDAATGEHSNAPAEPLRVPAGASLYVWLKLYGNKHLSALQSAGNSLARGLYPRTFTPGPSPQGLYLVVSAGLISFTIVSSIFRLKSTPSYSRPAAMRSAMAASSAM